MIIASAMALLYGLTFWMLRRAMFMVFIITALTCLYFALIAKLLDGSSYLDINYGYYSLLVAGGVYVLLGRAFRSDQVLGSLTGVLNGFGSLGVFGGAFGLMALNEQGSVLWASVYPLLLLGGFYLSVRLRSRSMLTFATLSMVAYVFYLTARYFAESMSWPAMLMLAGLVIIGAAYLAIVLRRRLFKV